MAGPEAAYTTSPPTLATFDVARLARVTRADLAAQAQRRALAAALEDGAGVARALEALVGVPVAIALVRAPAAAPAFAVSAAFAPALAPTSVFVIEAEAALARELASRALKLPASGVANPARGGSPELRGAFAAVVVATARAIGAPLRLAEDLPAATATSASLRVTVGGAAFDARVTFPRLPERSPGEVDPTRLGDAPLALPIVATSCLIARGELDALEIGDVFATALARGEDWRVALVAPEAERGVAARVGKDDALVIEAVPAAHSWDPPMTTDEKAPIDAALEAPIVVRVEVGSVRMTAREWAALRDGDVVATGVRLAGSPVVLRVGGVEVASGELVDVDGEYGVRITGMSKR